MIAYRDAHLVIYCDGCYRLIGYVDQLQDPRLAYGAAGHVCPDGKDCLAQAKKKRARRPAVR